MIRRLVLIAYTAALFVLAVTPPVPLPVPARGFGLKLYHVVAFFVFTLMVRYATGGKEGRPALFRALLLPFAVGVAIEAVQLFIPYRSGRWQDLISNAVGIGLGLVVIAAVQLIRRRLGERKDGPNGNPA